MGTVTADSAKPIDLGPFIAIDIQGTGTGTDDSIQWDAKQTLRGVYRLKRIVMRNFDRQCLCHVTLDDGGGTLTQITSKKHQITRTAFVEFRFDILIDLQFLKFFNFDFKYSSVSDRFDIVVLLEKLKWDKH